MNQITVPLVKNPDVIARFMVIIRIYSYRSQHMTTVL